MRVNCLAAAGSLQLETVATIFKSRGKYYQRSVSCLCWQMKGIWKEAVCLSISQRALPGRKPASLMPVEEHSYFRMSFSAAVLVLPCECVTGNLPKLQNGYQSPDHSQTDVAATLFKQKSGTTEAYIKFLKQLLCVETLRAGKAVSLYHVRAVEACCSCFHFGWGLREV